MAAFAGCGLPGFANFAGEVTVFFGAWDALPKFTVIAAWGALIVGAIYMLRAVRNMMHGPLAQNWNTLVDANPWRKIPYVVLLISLLGFGCFPGLLTNKIKVSADEIVAMANANAPAKVSGTNVAIAAGSGQRELRPEGLKSGKALTLNQ
jgi:NADH-quinone oxidoreductase subunit M